MECRDIRPLIRPQDGLSSSDRQKIDRHIAGCQACKDEINDPEAAFFAGVQLQLAMPPPHLTANILRRLPAASPIEIERRGHVWRRIYSAFAPRALVLLGVLAAVGVLVFQMPGVSAADRVPHLIVPLALAAKALLVAAGRPSVTLLALLLGLLGIVVIPRLLPERRQWPGLGSATLAGAALTCLLLLNLAATRGDTGSLSHSLSIADYQGDVTTVVGDIAVRGEVRGDVVSLAGHVTLQDGANVRGSVLAGGGIEQTDRSGIGQARIDGLGPLAAQAGGISGAPASLNQRLAAQIGGLLAVLTMVLLAALAVMIWPRRLTEAVAMLQQFPLRAVGLGIAATALLVMIALSGAVVLAATLGGLILVPALLFLVHLPFVAGMATVGEFLGVQLTGRGSVAGSLWGIGIQLLVIVLLGLVMPMAAVLIFYLITSVGLGGTLLGWSATAPSRL